MLKIFAILATVTGPVSCTVITASQRSMNTTVGGKIMLPCIYNFDASVSDLFIQWTFYNAKVKNSTMKSPCHSVSYKSASHCQKMVYMTDARGRCSWKNKIYYFQKGQPYTSPEYKNRIHVVNSTGNTSLTIFNMKPWETGIYTCEVLRFGTPPAQTEKSFPVYVLTPPSKPLCSFSHNPKVELGHFITLSCLSEIGMPNPKYYWHRVSGDTITRVSEYYDPQSGLLEIGNLTKLEEGYYQCIATNPLGNSTCQIDLTIKHSESGVIAAALIAAILAAALICVIVWVLTSKEKKKKRNEKVTNSEMQTMAQKEPLTSDYAVMPSQENVPLAAIPPSKDSNETGKYVTPDEIEVAAVPENERQEMEQQPVA